MFFKGHSKVVTCFDAYLVQYDKINLSIITYYEIVSGLKHRDARKQLDLFLEFVSHNTVLPLTEQSVTISSEIYADLRALGAPIDDIDLLIAGTAIANDMVLVTHNRKHFDRIKALEVDDWGEG
jgi:tRNA(fMet)-specific endonuclease VapC